MNPYNRLKKEFSEWVMNALHRHTITMWTYPKDSLSRDWSLEDLWQRTAAAEQLGFEVRLTADNDHGLVVDYVKKLPGKPWWL